MGVRFETCRSDGGVRRGIAMSRTFESKQAARDWVWSALTEREAARFPYPVEGRIPNYEGAEAAADRLLEHPLLDGADRIKVNPDSPQKHVRRKALEAGLIVFVPTPRLQGGFMRFDPASIPREHYRDASMISRWDEWAEPVALSEIPQLDAIVTGCVAVTDRGERCGKGEGYSDLEFGILRELGHDSVPVVTTVHPIQILEEFPTESHDVGLHVVCTPDDSIAIETPPVGPDGVDWSLLDDDDLEAMPVLRDLRDRDPDD